MLVKGDVQAESCFGNRPNRTEDRRGASRDHLPHTSLCFSQTGPNHETSSLPSRENRSATSCFHVRQDGRCAHFYSRSFLLWQYLVRAASPHVISRLGFLSNPPTTKYLIFRFWLSGTALSLQLVSAHQHDR